MANIKITELSAASSLAATDVVPVVDVSEDVTKKITATNLFRTLPDGTAAAPALSFASDAGNGVFLAGTDTVGISTGGTQRVTVDGSGNVTISGGLTVEGQTTTVESTIVTIDDKNIELGSVATPTNTTADGGGITLKGATDKTIKWINSTGYWTFNTGIEVGGHIQLDDSNEIKIGNSQDLRIYHDGVNSQIREVGTGDLRLRSSKIQLMNPNSEPYFVGTSDGSAEVYYDNSKKLETKSDGIDVTGEVQCDSLDVDGPGDLSGNLTVGGELNFMGSEGHKYIDCNLGSAALNIRGTSGGDINHAFLAKFIRNGPVELYYSNTQKFATKSDGIDVTGEVQCDFLDVDGGVDIDGGQVFYDATNNLLRWADGARATFGASNDLQIKHDGANSLITNSTGNLKLRSNTVHLNNNADNESMALFTAHGAVELFYDNSKKFQTKSDGIDVIGEVQCDSLDVDGTVDITGDVNLHANLDMQDNDRLNIGSSNDFTIRHNGTDTHIENDTGTLFISQHQDDQDIAIRTDDGSGAVTNYILCDGSEGNVRLYHYGTQKLGTKSDGIDVAGEVQCDSLDVDGALDIDGGQIYYDAANNNLHFIDNVKARFGTGSDLRIYHDGSTSYIDDAGTGGLDIRSNEVKLSKYTGETLATFTADGSVSLRYNNAIKFETKGDGIDVTGEVQCDSLDVDGGFNIDGGQFTFDASNNRLNLADNVELRVGTGSDLRIYHNGTNTHISNTTGGLYIDQNLDDGDIILRSDDGSGGVTNYIACDGSAGEVRLYHYGSEKLNTKSDGIDVAGEVQCDSLDVDGAADISGNVTLHANLDLQDDDKILLGTGDDLAIYHSTNSHIDNYVGELAIRNFADDLDITLQTDSGSGGIATYVRCDGSSGEVQLSHYGSQKLRTKSDGIDVTGEVQCDYLDLDGGFNINGSQITYDAANTNMKFADNIQLRFGAGNDLRIYHDGGNSYIQDTGTGNLSLQSNGSEIQLAKGGTFEHMVRAIVDGAVELYHNGSKKFETKSDGVLVIGELESNTLDVNGVANIGASDTSDAQLEIGAGATGNRNSYVDLIGDTTYTDYGLRVQRDNGGANGASKILHRGTGDFRFVAQEAAAMEFFTSNVERLRIDSSGRLLLGTTTEGHVDADDLTVSSSGHAGITIRSGTTSHGAVYFSDGTSGNAEYRGYIDYDQDEDYIRLGSAAVERFRITSTGAWAIEGGSNYGTSGQVLTSNGNDAPTWQDLASVSVGGSSAISMNDNVKINFGNSNDLQIYHNGTNSVIADAGNGNLSLQTNDSEINFWNSTDSAYLLKATGSGSVELYHAGTKKFETKSDGIDVVGEVQCDSLDVDGSADITGQATIHSHLNIGGELGLMGTSDGNKYIDSRLGSGSLIFRGTSGGDANHTNLAVFTRTGAITLYHNNSPKFATKADGIDVTGEVQCDSLDVDGGANISGTTVFQGDVGIGNVSPGNSFDNGKSLALGDNDTGIRQNGDGVLELWSNNAQCFRVRNTGNISYVHLLPGSNNSYDLGTSGNRWRNVYTNDLNLSNEGSGNDVDGTWGNYTIQEGEDDLFLINRRNGKKYKFNLTEVS